MDVQNRERYFQGIAYALKISIIGMRAFGQLLAFGSQRTVQQAQPLTTRELDALAAQTDLNAANLTRPVYQIQLLSLFKQDLKQKSAML